MATTGRIVNYTCQPELGRLADGFNGPEIMQLCDAREGRIQKAAGPGAERTDAASGTEYSRIQLQTLWKALVEPLMDRLQAVCTSRPQLCKESDDGKGIPDA